MKTAQVKLSQLAVNAENPRTISGEKFQLLTKSILVFPKMLELRPVVVSKTMMVLGGNMRTNALNEIAKMSKEALIAMLEDTRDYQKLTDTAKQALVDYWCKWQKNPVATIVNADDLTKDEVKQFVIKDNASFGTWNYDKLTEKWDSSDLNDWGIDMLNDETTSEGEREQAENPRQDKDLSDSIEDAFRIEVVLNNETEQEELYNRLTEEGFACRILTL